MKNGQGPTSAPELLMAKRTEEKQALKGVAFKNIEMHHAIARLALLLINPSVLECFIGL